MFAFLGNIMFSELSFKRKCKKGVSFRNADFGVNIKFSYMIAGRKDEVFCRTVTKTSIFFAGI